MVFHVNKQVVKTLKFLQLTDQYFIANIIQCIEEYYYAPNEIIAPEQIWVDQLFIVSKGIIGIYSPCGELIAKFGSNSYFGANYIVNPKENPIIIASQTYSNVRTLDRKHLDDVFDIYPRYRQQILKDLEDSSEYELKIIHSKLNKKTKSVTIKPEIIKGLKKHQDNTLSQPKNKDELVDLVLKLNKMLGIKYEY